MNKKYNILIICVIIAAVFMFSGCSKKVQTADGSQGVLYSKDRELQISYDSQVWRESDFGDKFGKGIGIKSGNGVAGGVVIREFRESITEEQYLYGMIQNFKKSEVPGTTSSSKLVVAGKEYSVIHTVMSGEAGNFDTVYDILYIPNGVKQYEVLFFASSKAYEQNKGIAMEVLKSAQLLVKTVVTNDPEISKGIKDMDKMTGIDKQSVINNLSKGGAEFVGAWGDKKSDGTIDVRLVINSDGTYKRYKQFPDEINIMSGTWTYNGDQVLRLHTTKATDNGKDVMALIEQSPELEIVSFKDGGMKIRNLKTLNEYVYMKK